MPQDIRNFFGAKASSSSKKKPSEDKNEDAQEQLTKLKKKPNKKRVIQDSDSDSDFVAASPMGKKSKSQEEKSKYFDKKSGEKEKSADKKLKPINPADFFGGGASSSSTASKKAASDKSKENIPKAEKEESSSPKKESSKVKEDCSRQKSKEKEPSPKKKESKKESPKDEKPSKRKHEDEKKSSKDESKTKLKSPKKEILEEPKKKSPKKEESQKAKSPKKEIKEEPKASTSSQVKPKASTPLTAADVPLPPKKVLPPSDPNAEEQLWVEKYKPQNLKAIIGQQGDKSNMRKLINWLTNWSKHHGKTGVKPPPRPPPWGASGDNGAWAKVALLSGPPGVGKTTTAYLVAKDLGFDVMELNASDSRSKKLLEKMVQDAMTSQSLSNTSKKRVILMDEVDGMAGNEDRGGMAELIQLIKKSKTPVICMCNDRQHQKIRSLANYCFDLRFQRPRVEQIRAAMMSIAFKEKVKVTPDALNEIIVGSNQDVRQVLHHLSMIKARQSDEKLTGAEAQKETKSSQKTSIKIGPFDVVRKVFSSSDQKGKSVIDKSDLFFQDYSLGPLFNQEMYLMSNPAAADGDPKKTMHLVAKAAESFCQGDLVEKTIRSHNSWSLLPTQAMFSSVIPGEYMSGYLTGQINFPSWFGKYSKQNKFERMLQELQHHTRLPSGVSKMALNLDLVQHLRNAILRPMIEKGAEGVAEAVEVMQTYSLVREDLDNLMEICSWVEGDNPFKNVDSKVKAAFTRMYNKQVVLPYATNIAVSKKRGGTGGGMAEDEGLMGEDDAEVDEDDEDADDISKDAMIKAKKPSKASTSKKAEPTAKAEAKGKGGGGGKGRGKKK